MKCMNRITTRGALSFLAVAGCLLYAMFAGAQNNEGGTSQTKSDCEIAWEDAPAEKYCTTTLVSYLSTGSGPDTCLIHVSTCSITVEVGGQSTDFTPNFPSEWSNMNIGISEDVTSNIDICFAASTTSASGWSASVKAGCPSDSTDSATAKKDGLPEPS